MNDDKLLHQDEIDALLKAAGGGGEEGQNTEPQPGESGENRTVEDADTGDKIADSVAETPDGQDAPGNASVTGSVAPEETPEEFSPQQSDDLDNILSSEEKDALGEIGNISMGSAATTLSQLLNKRVVITSPTVTVTSQKDFLKGFNMPFLVIKVKFKEGFDGYNVLIIKMHDAIVMANLMMGGDGIEMPEEISEMEISAAAEAMNQMIGTASTSLADLLNTSINIMPPEAELVRDTDRMEINLPFSDPIVVISFRMNIENMLDTSIMQVIDLDTAKEQSELLWKKFSGIEEEETTVFEEEVIPDLPADLGGDEPITGQDETPGIPGPEHDLQYSREPAGAHSPPQQTTYDTGRSLPPQIDPDKLNLLLDIPLKVSVVLGRTKKQIKDVLQMTPGAIVELETMVGEPVEIFVNGKLVARGEVVVVNENFGVKISSIISTRERINSLGNESFN